MPPDYIVGHWTDELWQLMVGKMIERHEAQAEKIKHPNRKRVSEQELFLAAGPSIKVVKRGD